MEIPESVQKAFLRLKSEYKFYIVLQLINSHYYVYKHENLWDRVKKRNKIKSEYLGKITEDGAFIKKAISKEEKQIAITEAFIEAHGGRIIWPSAEQETAPFEFTETDDRILALLSANARNSIVEISKRIGLSEPTVTKRIKDLEEKLGIRYTIDSTLERLHHYQFVALVKFIDERPNYLDIKKLVEDDPRIRLALSARGAYDLFIFMFVNEPLEAEEIIYKLRSSQTLSNYDSRWYVSYHSQSYGFIPPRDKFFELVEKRVWHKRKENPRKLPGQFFYREYAVVKELSQNSTTPFNLIDEKYGLKKGSAQNTYHRLLSDGSIRSATITMDKPPIKGTAIIVLEQENIDAFNKNKKGFFEYRLSDKNLPLNKLLFSGDLGSPYGLLIIAPLFHDGDLERLEMELADVAKGTKHQTSIVSDILVGNLGFRKIESKYTHLYKKLQEEQQIKQ